MVSVRPLTICAHTGIDMFDGFYWVYQVITFVRCMSFLAIYIYIGISYSVVFYVITISLYIDCFFLSCQIGVVYISDFSVGPFS